MKKILYILSAGFLTFYNKLSCSASIETEIDPSGGTIIKNADSGKDSIQIYLEFIRDFLFNILWIVAVGAFLYIGYLFVTARGKPEEFKKAWMHVVYVIIGIVVVSSAWGIVTIIAGIDL